MNQSNCLNDIFAVVVTYNSLFDKSDTMQSLDLALQKIDKKLDILIYDNSPKSYKDHYKKNNLDRFNITYFSDTSNSGVSAAYNKGAEVAKKLGKKWVLLLDQDTNFSPNIMEAYCSAISEYAEDIKLFSPVLKLKDGSIFSPCKYKFKRGFMLKDIKSGLHSLKSLSPVNSGMLIDIEAFFAVGGYNVKVWLDFSDFQFIERYKRNFKKFYIIDSIAVQDFSNESVSLGNALSRFKIYCECARQIEKRTFTGYVIYLGITLIRSLKLIIKFRNFSFIKAWYIHFFKKEKE